MNTTMNSPENLVITAICEESTSSIRVVVTGTQGPTDIADFDGGYFNPDPFSPISMESPHTCFTPPNGNGTYQVVFHVGPLRPGAPYRIKVEFNGGSHILDETWPTSVGSCGTTTAPCP